MKQLLLIIILSTLTLAYNQSHKVDSSFLIHKNKHTIEQLNYDYQYLEILFYRNDSLIKKDSIDIIGPGGYGDYIDFNNDGFIDFLITFFGNNPETNLFLFDSLTSTFKKVKDFIYYPEAKPVDSVNNLYYSYHRAGCADQVWVSDLFTIKNFETLHLANITGNGCSTDHNNFIQIEHIAFNRIHETLSFSILYDYDDKWAFIRDYWLNNYNQFTNP